MKTQTFKIKERIEENGMIIDLFLQGLTEEEQINFWAQTYAKMNVMKWMQDAIWLGLRRNWDK